LIAGSIARATLLAAAFTAAGCAPDPPFKARHFALGTLVEVSIAGVPEDRAQAAAEAVFAEMDEVHRTLHAWRPSTLGRINSRITTGEWFSLAPSALPVLELAARMHQASGGLFDPAVGALVETWGFHGDELPAAPPDPAAIAAVLAQRARMSDLEIDGIRMRAHNTGVRLDLGGIAKGYAVDLGITRLRAAGIQNAIVNAGGDLRAIGDKHGAPWVIGIRHPRQPGLLGTLEVRGDESVFTSGDYERYFDYQGKRYHHIIDPRTGYPADGATSVTVVHDNGAEADAAATALFIAGRTGWQATARALGMKLVMLVDPQGVVHMTPAMAARVHLADPAPAVQVEQP